MSNLWLRQSSKAFPLPNHSSLWEGDLSYPCWRGLVAIGSNQETLWRLLLFIHTTILRQTPTLVYVYPLIITIIIISFSTGCVCPKHKPLHSIICLILIDRWGLSIASWMLAFAVILHPAIIGPRAIEIQGFQRYIQISFCSSSEDSTHSLMR